MEQPALVDYPVSAPVLDAADFRVSQPDPYAGHLADTNKEREVISTEDIYNHRGHLLLRKHVNIDHACAQRLLQHRLQKPLEDQIRVKGALDSEAFLAEYSNFVNSHRDIFVAQRHLKFARELEILIKRMCLPHVVAQKMTVMKLRLPDQFQRALFSSWLAALIAREMNMDDAEIYAAFIAGLTHDIGFLHISPGILNKKQGETTVNDWRAIQSHVVIGCMVLKGYSDLPESVPQAVLEHHERCDGTGYPAAKEQKSLSRLGQIVAMADAIQALRMGIFAQSGRNLRDVLPFLRLNSHTHFYDTYRAMVDIVRKSGLEPTPVSHPQGNSRYVPQLVHRIDSLKNMVKSMSQIVEVLRNVESGPRGRVSLHGFKQVLNSINSSGMARDELLGWIALVDDNIDDTVLLEINEIELMQNELVWQISSAQRTFNAFLERECNVDSSLQSTLRMYNDRLRESLEKLKRI